MFCNFESAASSPWDSLVRYASSPSLASSSSVSSSDLTDENEATLHTRFPKLIPELEEGNVEYKLKLLNPSPNRFARLVTQLKWRLFEGGGQAYYELGVADSGLLIGLTEDELEKSLQTLEEMAGEIGASVFVVREVEVPDTLERLAAAASKNAGNSLDTRDDTSPVWQDEDDWLDADHQNVKLGSWDRERKRDALLPRQYACEQHDTADWDPRFGDPDPAVVNFALRAPEIVVNYDSDPGLFTMDTDSASDQEKAPAISKTTLFMPKQLLNISICSVYKPRPLRRRLHLTGKSLDHNHVTPDRRQVKSDKREKKQRKDLLVAKTPAADPDEHILTKTEKRRLLRDQRRENRKRTTLPSAATGQDVTRVGAVQSAEAVDAPSIHTQLVQLADELALLHVDQESISAMTKAHANTSTMAQGSPPGRSANGDSQPLEADAEATAPLKRRMIVEALVVRKLSAEEAYLDFGFEGFLP